MCNAAEGEPGTFKDRALLRHDPYRVLEGLAIASFAVGAEAAYIATKARYEREAERLATAIAEIEAAGLFADLKINLVLGPDEYLFGEEKALLEVIEGHDPLPRLLPPYEHGLFATDIQTGWQSVDEPATRGAQGQPNPTLVNNVETLAHVPRILREGADWFRSMGTAESPGTTVATVVGDVAAPFVGEIELGTPLWDLIAEAGGPARRAGRCRRCSPASPTPPSPRTTSTRRCPTRGWPRPAAGWARRASSSTTTPPAWWRWHASCPGSSTWRAAGSAAAASSAAARSPARSTRSRPATAPTATSR